MSPRWGLTPRLTDWLTDRQSQCDLTWLELSQLTVAFVWSEKLAAEAAESSRTQRKREICSWKRICINSNEDWEDSTRAVGVYNLVRQSQLCLVTSQINPITNQNPVSSETQMCDNMLNYVHTSIILNWTFTSSKWNYRALQNQRHLRTTCNKEMQQFGTKTNKLCDTKWYTSMTMYLWKDRTFVSITVTASHVTVIELTAKAIFPYPRPFNMEQFYPSCFLWFKMITRHFRLDMVWDLIQVGGRVPQPQTTPWVWQTHPTRPVPRLNTWCNKHQPSEVRWIKFCVFWKKLRNENKIQVSQSLLQDLQLH
jgi:hypothetical protein